MKKKSRLESQLQQWTERGFIDSAAATRILAFESNRSRQTNLNWPVYLALAFGGMLIASGIALFVAAHWEELSPAARFGLVLAMIAVFHAGGAMLADRFPALATTLHGVGTAVLGAGIFLAAQIFNLQENWPTGVLLWAMGAVAGYLLLRNWVQAGFVALLLPAWLIGQWSVTTQGQWGGEGPLGLGLLLAALAYLSARIGDQSDPVRRTLVWIGEIAIFPCAIAAIFLARENYGVERRVTRETEIVGWIVALAAPLAVAWIFRGKAVWANLVSVAWAFAVVECSATLRYGRPKPFFSILILYLLCALGAAALVMWGLQERRKERLNLGVAGFALTVLFFYFDGFMDKLDRSASLLVLGILCLAGGWLLERTRRRLVARVEVLA